MSISITGRTAAEIADSIRESVEAGALAAGDSLPPVRRLAEDLGVNRNTVIAAYRQLVQARVALTRGRAGTTIAGLPPLAEEGFAGDTVLRDVGSGNPDPLLLPDSSRALGAAFSARSLYGEPTVTAELAEWATGWIAADLTRDFRLTVTGGAVDAVERLLAQALTQGDAVALEDPCFLASIATVRLAGYRPVPVPVDDKGMTVEGLRDALAGGVRALVCTPRAHNPTGASLTAARAAALRRILQRHPHVLIIEDDHFSMLARSHYHTVVGRGHMRWALVRSVSKFLGPDLRLALVASDETTADRLATRISPGTTWVSRILQRLTCTLLTSPAVQADIDEARRHYATRNDAFVDLMAERGIAATAGDGLNVWVHIRTGGHAVDEQLMRRGWLVRTGDTFSVSGRDIPYLRLTVHTLTDEDAARLADDIAAAIAAQPVKAAGRSPERG